MLEECTAVFGRILKKESDRWFWDQYVPKNGTYILINMERNFECMTEPIEIYADKITGEIQGENNIFYRDIQYMDYYCKILGTDKSIFPKHKAIHSNNYYSFFIKKDNLKEKKTEKSLDGIIDAHYNILKNPYQKYKKKNAKHLYEQVEQKLGKVNVCEVEQIEKWLKTNLESVIEENQIDLNRKDYLKLFFVKSDLNKSKEEISIEGKRYLFLNLFNSNDYNIYTTEGLKGVPNNNMSLNSKKPYLESKTRKIKAPIQYSMEKVGLWNRFFDYLGGQAARGKNNIYVDLEKEKIRSFSDNERIESPESGIFLRIQQGKELEIHQIIRISGAGSFGKKSFYLKNVMEIDENALNQIDFHYGRIGSMQDLERVIDDVFFSQCLRYNYFKKAEEIRVNGSVQKKMLLLYREQLWSWFYQGKEQNIIQIIKKIGSEMIFIALPNEYKDQEMEKYIEKVKHRINLYVSLMDYLENSRRYEEIMNEVRQNLKEHIDCKGDWEFSSEEEYYYAVGQLVRVFFELNKSAKKNWSYINPILNSKNDKIILDKLLQLITRYNYAIEVNTEDDILKSRRIANLYEHLVFHPKLNSVNSNMIFTGFIADSLFAEDDMIGCK